MHKADNCVTSYSSSNISGYERISWKIGLGLTLLVVFHHILEVTAALQYQNASVTIRKY
jgi:hypothetical protein